MKYTGSFLNLDDKRYSINIITNNDSSSTHELLLGDTPIVTEIEGGDNMFKPVKYSSATIKVLTSDALLDIYSPKAQGTKVVLYGESNRTMWTGYVTPNMYNMNFECDLEELEIEAIDGLSTLQYIDYTTEKKSFISFTDIISSILAKCNCYRYFFLPTSFQENANKKEHFFTHCEVSEANFFDEDGEPMKCDEVLEELCKFMGVTAVADGDSVYFIDYDALQSRKPQYYRIEVGKADTGNIEGHLPDYKALTKDSYSENGTQISLGNTYSKVSVKDSLYSATDVFPVLDDLKLLSNKNGADNYELTINEYTNEDPKKNVNAFSFNKFVSHPYFEEVWYSSNMSEVKGFTPKTDADLYKYVGGTVLKNYTATIHPSEQAAEQEKEITHLNFKTNILISTQKMIDGSFKDLLRVKIPNPCVIGGEKTFLVLNGSVIFKKDKFDSCTDSDIERTDDLTSPDNLYICACLKVGNKYFTGIGGQWSDTRRWFPIFLDAKAKKDEQVHLYNTSYEFQSNITYQQGLQVDNGYALTLPDNIAISDDIEFSLTMPVFLPFDSYAGYLLSDFDASLEIANRNDDEIFESDTEYTSIIDNGYVNDFEGEEFLVCTWDNKQANYSAVIYRDDAGKTKYLDKIYNTATQQYMRSEELYIDRILRQYATPPIIFDMSLYNNIKPYTVFETQVACFSTGEWINKYPWIDVKRWLMSAESDKTEGAIMFIVDSQSIDWRLNTNKVKLIEKR